MHHSAIAPWKDQKRHEVSGHIAIQEMALEGKEVVGTVPAAELLRQGVPLAIAVQSLADVTRFLSFRLRDRSEKAEALFTLGLEIAGLPEDRDRAVLRAVIDSRDAFLRYLRLLLADLTDPLAAQFAADSNGSRAHWEGSPDDEPILEDMVRALSHGRDRLSAVRRLMERLEGTAEDGEVPVVPEEFIRLWDAFRAVMDDRGINR